MYSRHLGTYTHPFNHTPHCSNTTFCQINGHEKALTSHRLTDYGLSTDSLLRKKAGEGGGEEGRRRRRWRCLLTHDPNRVKTFGRNAQETALQLPRQRARVHWLMCHLNAHVPRYGTCFSSHPLSPIPAPMQGRVLSCSCPIPNDGQMPSRSHLRQAMGQNNIRP